MRKIKYLLALAALLLCVPALAAETPRLKIEVPGQNVKPQEEFTVTLSLHNIPSIAALGFHISYDKTRLELTGYEDAGQTPSEEPSTGDAAVPQPSGESPAVEAESPAAENSPLPIVITVAAVIAACGGAFLLRRRNRHLQDKP